MIIEFIKAKNYRKETNIKMCPFCGENEEIYLQQYEMQPVSVGALSALLVWLRLTEDATKRPAH